MRVFYLIYCQIGPVVESLMAIFFVASWSRISSDLAQSLAARAAERSSMSFSVSASIFGLSLIRLRPNNSSINCQSARVRSSV